MQILRIASTPPAARFICVWATAFLCLTCFTSLAHGAAPAASREDVLYPVEDFSLTERSGREVHASDLQGKVWVASFIFTRCKGPCKQVTATMARLQGDFAAEPDVRLVTFTVDPEYDDPNTLRQYADQTGADPDRWLFLTGKEADVYRLLREDFKIGASKNPDPKATPGEAVDHDTHLAVVDRHGRVRGYFAGLPDSGGDDPNEEFEQNLTRLREKVAALRDEDSRPAFFPPLNAALNALAGLLLLIGYGAIRRRMVQLHVACMLSALAVSAVFLASYLYFHLVVMHGQPTYFREKWPDAPRWVEAVYLAVLGSHTLLAAATAPLAVFTAYLGLRGRFARHVWIARWTLPIWLYVSATGVVVYWMLYRLY
jgi:protein SCO1